MENKERRLRQSDLRTEILSNKAVAMISEFALILYRKYGVLIDVDATNIIPLIFKNAMRRSDRRLQSIYLHIKTELSIKLIRQPL